MIKLFSKVYLSKTVVASLLVLFILSADSCSKIENMKPVYVSVNIEEPELVKIDFQEIQTRGTLRMITRYSPTSYFLLDGMDRGFEFELVSRFAKENGLKVEVVLIGSDEDPLQILESGKGDLIADYFAISEELFDQVTFSAPHSFINQVYDISEAVVENVSISKLPDEIGNLKTKQFQAEVRYPGEETPGMMVKKSDSIAWAVRKNAPDLKQKMDEFIGNHIQVCESDGRIIRSAYLNNLQSRYFKRDRFESRYHDRAYDIFNTGYLSPYDDLVKTIAEEAGLDWKLVIAVIAQESSFDPKAESWAGALGLMQIIPRFSKFEDKTELYDPEKNIREGVRYLKKHLNREAHLDSLNQHSLALAAYNVGMGNLADARELALRLGNDPDDWPHIADALTRLMHPEYYQHARYGYKKGTETVNYVEDVLNLYSRYNAIYKMAALFEDNTPNLFVMNR